MCFYQLAAESLVVFFKIIISFPLKKGILSVSDSYVIIFKREPIETFTFQSDLCSSVTHL